jgi:hypothetical protein
MKFELQQARAKKIEDKISQVWDILLASRSQVVRDRCCSIISRLESIADCYASGDGI